MQNRTAHTERTKPRNEAPSTQFRTIINSPADVSPVATARSDDPSTLTIHQWRANLREFFDASQYRTANPFAAVGNIACAWATIGLVTAAIIFVGNAFGNTAAFITYLLGLLLIARARRVLELYVHEASHFSIIRGSRFAARMNDFIANAFCAWPTLQNVASYRKNHTVHHSKYGSADDPCKNRASLDNLRSAGSHGLSTALLQLVKTMPAYIRGYYREMGTNLPALVKGLAWHASALTLLMIFAGLMAGALMWLCFWAVPFTLVLPALRAIAESEEHDYSRGREHQGTYNNIGWLHRWLIHPAGDAYHILHHGWADVPTHKLARLHNELQKSDLYNKTLTRRRVLE